MTANIYLEAIEPITDRTRVTLTLESYVCLSVYGYLKATAPAMRLFFVQPRVPTATIETAAPPQHSFQLDLSAVQLECIDHEEYANSLASLCAFPVLVSSGDVVVAGLCGVCRRMVKTCSPWHDGLLGFKGGCMLAPAEQSVWTRYCEVDVVRAVKQMLAARHTASTDELQLPAEFARFDHHMGQPVRMHNIYKVARQQAGKQKLPIDEELSRMLSDTHISSSVPMVTLNISHRYAEGQQMTLADLMLSTCFGLVCDQLLSESQRAGIADALPRLVEWLGTVSFETGIPLAELQPPIGGRPLQIDCTDQRSLYKNDSKRYKPRSEIFTKQPDIEAALAKVHALQLDIRSDASVRFSDADFTWWHTLPYDALPEGGALPADRLLRKKHQLQSLAVEVLRLARPGDRIVDFCSGAGHLGIVIATLRPDCEVLLLENKEESLMRARDRVERLQLRNVRYFQCNLDYFCGPFAVGTSLHACGVATDIVLEHCMGRGAAFVCCPCCYGGCRAVPHIEYPRSAEFAQRAAMSAQDCMHVAHCADQAHDVRSGPCNELKAAQGQLCMDVMDWDRKLCAEERGYEVVLTRLQPEECTPKNRLLVGSRKTIVGANDE